MNYLALRKKALALISKYGQTAILSQAGAMVGPAWAATPGTPMETPVTVVVTASAQKAIPEGSAMRLVKTVLVAVPDLVSPKKGDTLIFADAAHELLEARPLAPAGTVILFEVDAAT